jgi:hypothetical protein
MDRNRFFAQLDRLTPKEIEERLPSLDKEKLILVLEYFAQRDRGKATRARPWGNVVTERTIAAALIALGLVLAALILRGGYEVAASNVGAYVINRFTGATWQCLDTCVPLETGSKEKK